MIGKMKRIKHIFTFGLVVLIFNSFNCQAQSTDINADYEKALQLYNYGMADSALSILKTCIANRKELNNLSPERRASVYRLAALSDIMTGNSEEAEAYARRMVTNKPDYRNHFQADDLMEFRLIVQKTIPQPSLRIGLIGGFNIPFVNVQKKYSDYESTAGTYTVTKMAGYQIGIVVENTIAKRVSIEASPGMTQILFKYINRDIESTQYEYDQSVTYLEIPIVCRYIFSHDKPFKPYLQGGIGCRFPLFPREYSSDYGKYWLTQSSNSDKILTTFETDVETIGLVLGGGAGYDFKNLSIRLDLRYNYNFKSSAKSSEFDNISGYDDISPNEKFHYTDDINLINLKYLQVSVGFLYNLKYKVF
jgi:Outer membrane protein beta-barrel domain